MKLQLDLKSIGYGFATFIAGTLIMTLIGTTIGGFTQPPIGKGQLALVKIVGYLAPVVAGYVAAYYAPSQRILHGTIGGSIGALLLIAPALLVPNYQFWGIPIILTFYAALAALGAIGGNYWRKRVGP
jgi:hypothetical protein